MTERIRFVDLGRNYRSLKPAIDAAIAAVLDQSAFILGKPVREFEAAATAAFGSKHALGVSSGTDALLFILKALGLGPGDEVILPANTFIATAEAVVHGGATPVFVDMADDYNLDVTRLDAAVTPRTRAVIAVHLYGRPAPMAELAAFCAAKKLHLIEDACQAHGATFRGRCCGTLGLAGALSFYPGKNLGGYGDGGMILTDDDTLFAYLEKLRDHGSIRKYAHEFPGYTGRLDGLQAAILAVKLPHLARWNEQRRTAAGWYRTLFAATRLPIVLPPRDDADRMSNCHLFVIQCDRRDELQRHLAAREIESGIHYPVPLHLTPAFAARGYAAGSFPRCEAAAGRLLSLPMFPELTRAEIERVVGAIGEFYAGVSQ